MLKHVDLNNLYYVSILDFDGDIVLTKTMITDDVSKIITYLKDQYSTQGFYYEISKLVVAELPMISDLL